MWEPQILSQQGMLGFYMLQGVNLLLEQPKKIDEGCALFEEAFRAAIRQQVEAEA